MEVRAHLAVHLQAAVDPLNSVEVVGELVPLVQMPPPAGLDLPHLPVPVVKVPAEIGLRVRVVVLPGAPLPNLRHGQGDVELPQTGFRVRPLVSRKPVWGSSTSPCPCRRFGSGAPGRTTTRTRRPISAGTLTTGTGRCGRSRPAGGGIWTSGTSSPTTSTELSGSTAA